MLPHKTPLIGQRNEWIVYKSTALRNLLSQKTGLWNRFWKKVWDPGAYGPHLLSPLWPFVVWLPGHDPVFGGVDGL